MNKIIHRYILHEFCLPFLGGLGIFSFILIMDKILRIIDLVLLKGIGIQYLGKMLLYLSPPLFSFTIPMAILFGTLMTFGRLASDSEVTALLSCGLHPLKIFTPILLFSVVSMVCCLWLEIFIIPSANNAFRTILLSLEQKKAFFTLNEEEFQDFGKTMVAFVKKNKASSAGEMHYDGVLIADQEKTGESRIILAQEGHITIEKYSGKLDIALREGSIHHLDANNPQPYQMLKFGQYEMRIPLTDLGSASPKKQEKELTQSEISQLIHSLSISFSDTTKLSLEWHRRLAFPTACIVFSFIGSLIGMVSKWSGKSSCFAISLILILIYYFIMIAGYRMSMAGYSVPWISVWLPNIIFLLLSLEFCREKF